jgi:hypothetical protein
LCLDASNAFGEVKRATISDGLRDLAVLHPIFNLVYHNTSTVVAFVDGTKVQLQVAEGVLQGCAAAPFLFSLALAHSLRNLPTAARTATLHVVADDIALTYTDPAVLVLFTFPYVAAALEENGIFINKDKSSLLFDSYLPPHVLTPLSDYGLSVRRRTDYLGGTLSAANNLAPVSLQDIRARYSDAMTAVERFSSRIAKQCAKARRVQCLLAVDRAKRLHSGHLSSSSARELPVT